MPHSFGLTALPMAEPNPTANPPASLDPALDVLSDALATILTAWIGAAWSATIPGVDPLIKTVKVFAPDSVQSDTFPIVPSDLPALYVYRHVGGGVRITDELEEFESEIWAAWIPQSRDMQGVDNSPVDPLFGVFSKAIGFLTSRGRDKSWVSVVDREASSDVAVEAERKIARTYGSDIRDACGFESWKQPPKNAFTRFHFFVGHQRYDGFAAKIIATEWSTFDPAAAGYVPTSIEAAVTTGGVAPLTPAGFRFPPDT